MSAKMVVTRPQKNRKKEQIRRHRQRHWWKSNDIDRAQHLYECGFCYIWVMTQIASSAVKYDSDGWRF